MTQRDVVSPCGELTGRLQRRRVGVAQIQRRPGDVAAPTPRPPAAPAIRRAAVRRRRGRASRAGPVPARCPTGSRIRLCRGMASTAATQPSWSTASAGLPMRARIGAATIRSRFSVRSCCSRRCDSANRATASTSATVVGCTVAAGPGDVDDADHLAGSRILDRRARARPRVVAAQVVLGGEHLHGAPRRQRGADGVGADGVLRPVRALDEAEPIGLAEYLIGARPPQHPALRVGHHEYVLAFCDKRFQAAGDLVEDAEQTRRASQRVQPVRLDHRCGHAVGVDALGHQPLPGVPDHLARSGRRAVACHRGVVHGRHQPGIVARILADRDSGLGHRRTLHHSRLCSRSQWVSSGGVDQNLHLRARVQRLESLVDDVVDGDLGRPSRWCRRCPAPSAR